MELHYPRSLGTGRQGQGEEVRGRRQARGHGNFQFDWQFFKFACDGGDDLERASDHVQTVCGDGDERVWLLLRFLRGREGHKEGEVVDGGLTAGVKTVAA